MRSNSYELNMQQLLVASHTEQAHRKHVWRHICLHIWLWHFSYMNIFVFFYMTEPYMRQVIYVTYIALFNTYMTICFIHVSYMTVPHGLLRAVSNSPCQKFTTEDQQLHTTTRRRKVIVDLPILSHMAVYPISRAALLHRIHRKKLLYSEYTCKCKTN